MTDGDLLRAVAAALHGPLWQNALARALDVNERTVRRWAADRLPVPAGVWARIQAMLERRTSTLLGELRSRSR